MKRIYLLVLVVIFIACKKNNQSTIIIQPPEVEPVILDSLAKGTPVSLTIAQDQAGYNIAEDFLGLSYETDILLQHPNLLNVNNTILTRLVGNLGPGLLRVGGDSSDEIYWTGKSSAHNSHLDSLTTVHVDNLAAFSKATGWPVLFGINLGKYNPVAAASLATYLRSSIGTQLHALQFGNEPDTFEKDGFRTSVYTDSKFHNEWENYFNSVSAAVPSALLAGPDVIGGASWVTSFAAKHNSRVAYLTCHYYNNGPNTNPAINYKTILEPDSKVLNYLKEVNQSAKQYNLTYRVSECNSIFDGGGKTGVSDVFASALWALDFMWIVAENNGQGVNFHGGASQYFSPIEYIKGVSKPRPLYYGMLAFKHGSNSGNVVPVSVSQSSINHSVHACVKSDSTFITLINKDETDLLYTVKLKKAAGKLDVLRLKAPAIDSPTGVTFGGSTVKDDGTFAVNKDSVKTYTVNKTAFVIHVPALSAAILKIDGK